MGLRQLDVACKLGFTTTDRISHWEKGQAYPSIVNLFKLAGIYNCMPQDLYRDLFREVCQTFDASLEQSMPQRESERDSPELLAFLVHRQEGQ